MTTLPSGMLSTSGVQGLNTLSTPTVNAQPRPISHPGAQKLEHAPLLWQAAVKVHSWFTNPRQAPSNGTAIMGTLVGTAAAYFGARTYAYLTNNRSAPIKTIALIGGLAVKVLSDYAYGSSAPPPTLEETTKAIKSNATARLSEESKVRDALYQKSIYTYEIAAKGNLPDLVSTLADQYVAAKAELERVKAENAQLHQQLGQAQGLLNQYQGLLQTYQAQGQRGAPPQPNPGDNRPRPRGGQPPNPQPAPHPQPNNLGGLPLNAPAGWR